MIGNVPQRSTEVIQFELNDQQANFLDCAARQVGAMGGPDVAGSAKTSIFHAQALMRLMGRPQRDLLELFSNGKVAAIEFTGMREPEQDPAPKFLPPVDIICNEPTTLYLSSRSQILLSLVNYRSFAFDIDNESKQIRIVGNFKGGGAVGLPSETGSVTAELSSHSGLELGPHTEPPYNCSLNAENGHSPAPSALILTARWTPSQEPTKLIPVRNVIAKLNGLEALALSSKSFCFSRSECFVKDDSEDMLEHSIIQFDPRGDFTLRYNSYRYSVHEKASQLARQAYWSLKDLLNQADCYEFVLQPTSALLINNSQALHARDTIKDNRRLLIRLFGYSPDTQPLILQQDPLIVRG